MSHDISHDTPAELLHRFFSRLDDRRYEDMVALLEPDATWHRQGKLLQGREQVLAALRERSPDKQIRHVISNTFTDAGAPGTCTTTAYQTVYQRPEPVDGRVGPTLPNKISVVTAELRRDGDAGWRIRTLSSVLGLDLKGG